MKVALVYDRVNKWGGAERVLLALQKLFSDAPLYTSVYNPKTASWAKDFRVKPSFLQNFPLAKNAHELYAPLMPLAFESFNFDSYDLVISVTSEAAKGIITKPSTTHICYCLTPTRYLWSGYSNYFNLGIKKTLSRPIVTYLRTWDMVAAQRPDAFIAISQEVKKRIKKYYERDADIVYPPVTLATALKADKKDIKKDYFLVVSRLVPYKRVDLVIKACNNLKLPLKIIGTGSEDARLRSIAGSNVEFLGSLTDQELVGYYRKSKALVFSGIEDFGLTVIEAQRMGVPIIAYRGGGALETVLEGKTGEFFKEQSVESLSQVLKRFDYKKYKVNDMVTNAENFNQTTFEKQFLKQIGNIISRKAVKK